MKKIVIIITNLILSFAVIGSSTDEYLKLNTNKFDNLIRFERLEDSINPIEYTKQPEITYTIVKEKKAEKPDKTEKIEYSGTDKSVETETEVPDNNKEAEVSSSQSETQDNEYFSPEPQDEETKKEKVDPFADIPSGGYVSFNNLNETGGVETLTPEFKSYADQIMDYIYNGEEDYHYFVFENLSSEDFDKVITAINRTYYDYGRKDIRCFDCASLGYGLMVDASRARLAENAVVKNYVINAVNNCVSPDMTEKEAAVAINNYIRNNFIYESESYDLYEAISTGQFNCLGYAHLFQLMCRQCGIECEFWASQDHAWNRVFLGGNPYWADICWNRNKDKNEYLLKTELWKDSSHINGSLSTPHNWGQ